MIKEDYALLHYSSYHQGQLVQGKVYICIWIIQCSSLLTERSIISYNKTFIKVSKVKAIIDSSHRQGQGILMAPFHH